MALSVRFERRATTPLGLRVIVLSLAVVLGAFAGGLLVQASGYSALTAFSAILEGSFGGTYPISQTLAAAIPLATIALGTAVAFRVQLWNIGGEGQFYMGAFGATAVELIGGPAGWPAIVLLPAMMVGGFVAGAGWALLPGWLRAWHGVNEIITTLMLNYVAVLWVNYLVYGPWKDPAGRNFPFSPRFPDSATFSRFGEGQLHVGIWVPVVAAIVLVLVLARTRWGYELRVVGENAEAARYAGINVRSTMLTAMLVSGGMAGLAGMVQVAGIIHLLNGQLSTNYGYTAIIVAWLARLHPLAVLVVSVLFGALVNGGFAVSQVGIPQALGGVLQGMILFFVLGIGDLFTRYRLRIVSLPSTVTAAAARGTST
ncbi:MAG TPA: ABC transporter permease [Chloroflexota bacterium]|jgi:simple sugar transport system permease protein|nr:ABC transporter permease [Chloroflexota bacterium]